MHDVVGAVHKSMCATWDGVIVREKLIESNERNVPSSFHLVFCLSPFPQPVLLLSLLWPRLLLMPFIQLNDSRTRKVRSPFIIPSLLSFSSSLPSLRTSASSLIPFDPLSVDQTGISGPAFIGRNLDRRDACSLYSRLLSCPRQSCSPVKAGYGK